MGTRLRYWLQAQRRTWLEILDVFIAAGRGLAAAHEKDLVHRDFKPDNVMVASTGQVRVMDFGLARRGSTATAGLDADAGAPLGDVAVPPGATPRHSSTAVIDPEATQNLNTSARSTAPGTPTAIDKLTRTGTLMGTPAYMSPEQFRGRYADARSDQFSFCVALYEALYEARPFGGRSFAELAEHVVGGRLIEPPDSETIPTWLRAALKRGLSANPQDRFPSMNELLAELDRRPGAARTGFASGAAARLDGIWTLAASDETARPATKSSWPPRRTRCTPRSSPPARPTPRPRSTGPARCSIATSSAGRPSTSRPARRPTCAASSPPRCWTFASSA